MSFDQLPSEVWALIVPNLIKPLPKPLSGLTQEEAFIYTDEKGHDPKDELLPLLGAPGTVGRGDIRAHDLAVLMRTSVAFNAYAAPSLYDRVITDDLLGFLSHLDRPAAHPHVKSKRELLELTHYLHVEYPRLGEPISYPELLQGGIPMSWFGFDVLPSFKFPWASLQAWTNLDRLLPRLRALPSPKILPNLKHVALGAIFGAQDKLWQSNARIVDEVGMIGHRIAECAELIEGIIHASSASHICFRAGAGPLSLLPSADWRAETSDRRLPFPLVNVHFDLATTTMPAVRGHPVRWLLESKGADKLDPKDEMRDVCKESGRLLGDIKKRREKAQSPQTGYDVEIYASSDRARPTPPFRTLGLLRSLSN